MLRKYTAAYLWMVRETGLQNLILKISKKALKKNLRMYLHTDVQNGLGSLKI